jgi:archaellum biogenesis ATPase FlaH
MSSLEEMYADWGLSKEEIAQALKKSEVCALDKLTRFSITGASEQLRDKMLADRFVLEGIAILGQWTTIYGSPNSGKTLITNWLLRESIESGQIESDSVFYINADDHFRGLVEKTELAEDWCMHVIAPHHNDFAVNQIPDLMTEMARDGSASGIIFVLDTLKKFTDLMDKRAASDFGKAARGFVSAGGTLIALAHTSDIVDDSDCCYLIDKISTTETSVDTVHTVEFRNIKMRGDVEPSIGFSYRRNAGQSYIELLNSVERIGDDDVEKLKSFAEAQEQLTRDEPIIIAVCSLIAEGVNTKDQLIKNAKARTQASTRQIKEVLDRRTGDSYMLGDRWTTQRGAHNRHQYAVLEAPSQN